MRLAHLLCLSVLFAVPAYSEVSRGATSEKEEPPVFEPLTTLDARGFFAQHNFCHVELRKPAVKETPRAAGKRNAQEPAEEPDGSVSPPEKPVEFADQTLLAVSGSSEKLRVRLEDKLVDFEVSKRRRDRLDIVLTLKEVDGARTLVLRQTKPLLGCIDAPVKTCRMSQAELALQKPEMLPADASEEVLKAFVPVKLDVRDLCGSLRKETMFRAPIDLNGLSEWKNE